MLAGAALSPALASANVTASVNFAIPRAVINAGVADMSSVNYRLASSLGDAIAGGTINSVGYQLKGGFRVEIGAPPAVLNLLSVFSRKLHRGAPFELVVARDRPITGSITVEPRAAGGGHIVVFRFDGPVTTEGAATALDAALNAAATVTLVRDGNDVIATLANVADNKRLTIKLTGVNTTTSVEVSLGFMLGDINSSRAVNAADLSAIKANLGKPLNINNFQYDLNVDGSITPSDLSIAKARSGLAIPP